MAEGNPLRPRIGKFAAGLPFGRLAAPAGYAEQFVIDHPDEDSSTLAADALVAVETFGEALLQHQSPAQRRRRSSTALFTATDR